MIKNVVDTLVTYKSIYVVLTLSGLVLKRLSAFHAGAAIQPISSEQLRVVDRGYLGTGKNA